MNMLAKNEDTPPFNVGGVLMFRGTEFPPTLKDDVPDSEYYTWKKLDSTNSADQKTIVEAFCADHIGDLEVVERKYFK